MLDSIFFDPVNHDNVDLLSRAVYEGVDYPMLMSLHLSIVSRIITCYPNACTNFINLLASQLDKPPDDIQGIPVDFKSLRLSTSSDSTVFNRSAVRRLAGQDDFGNSIRSTKAIGHGIGHRHVQRIAGSSTKNISHPSGM